MTKESLDRTLAPFVALADVAHEHHQGHATQ